MSTTWINRGHFYVPHVKPVLLDCNFKVGSSDAAGLGIVSGSLKGQGIQNVFMHTSSTPGKGPNGLLNPNPAAGLIIVQLADNFQRYFGGFNGFTSPLSGSNLNVDASDAALTANVTYVITAVGTSTAADWLALGVPPGVIAAPGVTFVAKATGAGTGNGTVQLPATAGAGVFTIEVIGDPNTTINPIPVGGSPNVGGFITLQCFKDSAGDTPVIGTPADNTVISLAFYLSQSSVKVAGE